MRINNLDLEDKGKSGETFFSAVQFMYHFGPKFCIFENVKNAPWEKMQEYITVRPVALAPSLSPLAEPAFARIRAHACTRPIRPRVITNVG